MTLKKRGEVSYYFTFTHGTITRRVGEGGSRKVLGSLYLQRSKREKIEQMREEGFNIRSVNIFPPIFSSEYDDIS